MAETEKEDAVSSEAESSAHISNNSPTKRRRGRPQGSKKLKVCVTDVNLMELVSGISNGASTHPQRSRGRPKLSNHTAEEESADAENSVQTHRGKGRLKGSKKKTNDSDSPVTDHTPKKRGRPKKSQSPDKATAEDLANGSNTTKMLLGRPKGSVKRKSESLTSCEENEGSSKKARKRGRPKGSLNKKNRLDKEVNSEKEEESDESLNSRKRGRSGLRKVEVNNSDNTVSTEDTSNGVSDTPRKGRGRPRKSAEQKRLDYREPITDDSQPKRGRGRPKGSLNKKPPAYRVQGKVGRPLRTYVPLAIERRSRLRKQPAKRGRPRKYPLPSPEELKKPKVWKPLGRPRKYPRVDPPEGAAPAPRRSRGRPRKSESKKGAHLRKSLPAAPAQRNTNDGAPRKRGRPPSSAKGEGVAPRKRGRPKGSPNKKKARSELNNSTYPCLSEKSDSSAAGLDDGESTGTQALPEEHAEA
ncbi:chromosomal protein D1 [Betta splendens]|uniref:Chromosomal protein D1 n=1 Tax=Betta splendens TaxID=158456 RepID=A0A6P7NZM7_BETSP|nr:chromosomal protein D1 [Betta splendens]